MAVTVGGNSWNVSQGDGYRRTGGPSNDVRAFQQALADAGYSPGPIDGIYGPKTQAAYNRYLEAEGKDGPSGEKAGDPEERDYNTVPGSPEIWKNGDQYYFVYYVPDTEPPVPVTYKASKEEVEAAFGPDNEIEVDKTVTTQQMKEAGALHFGMADELANQTSDPIQTLVDDIEKQKDVRPWLSDPTVVNVLMEAVLEGRSPSEAEFEATDWWQEHNEQQRQWMLETHADPLTAQRRKEDQRLTVRSELEQAGMRNPPDDVVNFIADKVVRGDWSATYGSTQILKLTDPAYNAELDKELSDLTSGMELDTTQDEFDNVRDTVLEWLGPKFGAWSDAKIEKWAGRLRNDPDGELALENALRAQRQSLFPEYTNPDLTYQDISQPWLQLGDQMWGQQLDETDPFFLDIVKRNDAQYAEKQFRSEGLKRKNKQVLRQISAEFNNQFSEVRNPSGA